MRKILLFLSMGLLIASFSFSTTFASPEKFTTQMAAKIIYGKAAEEIIFLKQTLHEAGFYMTEAVDPDFSNNFDKELRDALIEFQTANEIKPTGTLDPTTIKLLNDFLEYQYEQDNRNPYLDSESGVDKYSDSNSENNYTSTFEYKTDFSDVYDNIPLIKDAVDVIGSVVSKDSKTLYLTNKSTNNSAEETGNYYFVGEFDFIACLADVRCIDLESLYEDQ